VSIDRTNRLIRQIHLATLRMLLADLPEPISEQHHRDELRFQISGADDLTVWADALDCPAEIVVSDTTDGYRHLTVTGQIDGYRIEVVQVVRLSGGESDA
jgi:hypothetical protein